MNTFLLQRRTFKVKSKQKMLWNVFYLSISLSIFFLWSKICSYFSLTRLFAQVTSCSFKSYKKNNFFICSWCCRCTCTPLIRSWSLSTLLHMQGNLDPFNLLIGNLKPLWCCKKKSDRKADRWINITEQSAAIKITAGRSIRSLSDG